MVKYTKRHESTRTTPHSVPGGRGGRVRPLHDGRPHWDGRPTQRAERPLRTRVYCRSRPERHRIRRQGPVRHPDPDAGTRTGPSVRRRHHPRPRQRRNDRPRRCPRLRRRDRAARPRSPPRSARRHGQGDPGRTLRPPCHPDARTGHRHHPGRDRQQLLLPAPLCRRQEARAQRLRARHHTGGLLPLCLRPRRGRRLLQLQPRIPPQIPRPPPHRPPGRPPHPRTGERRSLWHAGGRRQTSAARRDRRGRLARGPVPDPDGRRAVGPRHRRERACAASSRPARPRGRGGPHGPLHAVPHQRHLARRAGRRATRGTALGGSSGCSRRSAAR